VVAGFYSPPIGVTYAIEAAAAAGVIVVARVLRPDGPATNQHDDRANR
jgi:hypothetical protein